jgi:hypothetical protein
MRNKLGHCRPRPARALPSSLQSRAARWVSSRRRPSILVAMSGPGRKPTRLAVLADRPRPNALPAVPVALPSTGRKTRRPARRCRPALAARCTPRTRSKVCHQGCRKKPLAAPSSPHSAGRRGIRQVVQETASVLIDRLPPGPTLPLRLAEVRRPWVRPFSSRKAVHAPWAGAGAPRSRRRRRKLGPRRPSEIHVLSGLFSTQEFGPRSADWRRWFIGGPCRRHPTAGPLGRPPSRPSAAGRSAAAQRGQPPLPPLLRSVAPTSPAQAGRRTRRTVNQVCRSRRSPSSAPPERCSRSARRRCRRPPTSSAACTRYRPTSAARCTDLHGQ